MLLKIIVEDSTPITKTKRDKSGTYMVQEAWAYTFGPNGVHPHPQRIEIFPPKDNSGNPVYYQKGEYALSPDSLNVRFARFDVFVKLVPYEQALNYIKQILIEAKKQAA